MEDRPTISLYETDYIAWAEAQAEALRSVPQLVEHGVDLENLIEEVETLARQEFREFEDALRSALSRLIRAAFEPDASLARRPLSEVACFLQAARTRRSPTALGRLNLDLLWAEAWVEAEGFLPDGALPDTAAGCPFEVETLLRRGFFLRSALERIRDLRCE
jgi:hypothetical protein